MIKIERTPAPAWLEENAQRWGAEYANKNNPRFRWKSYKGSTVDKHLIPLLKDMTNDHCSFCDDYEIVGEIERFRPTSREPLLAYEWSNLFYCCHPCNQKKGSRFNEDLLKPDEETYSFEIYFIYDSITGEIKPNLASSADDIERAKETIKLYGLKSVHILE